MMKEKPNDIISAWGNQDTGNPPAGSPAAWAMDVQAQTSSREKIERTEMASRGLSGSLLPVEVDDLSSDGLSSNGTLTQSMESLLLTEKDVAANAMETSEDTQEDQRNTVNPGVSTGLPSVTLQPVPINNQESAAVLTVRTINPGSQERVGKQSPVADTPGRVSQTAKRRRRRKRNKERKLEAKAESDAVPVSLSTPVAGGGKRSRSVDLSTEMESSVKVCPESVKVKERKNVTKRRKVSKTKSVSCSTSSTPLDVRSGGKVPSGVSSGDIGPSCSTKSRQTQKSAESQPPSSGLSFSEAAAQTLMVAIQADNSRGTMTEGQLDYVDSHLWKLVGESKDAPTFEGMSIQDGIFKVQCSDSRSLEWLTQKVAEIPVYEGCKFVVKNSSSQHRLVRATVCIQGKPRKPHEIVARLCAQNKELNTALWRVYSYSTIKKDPRNGDTSFLVLGIDPESVKTLRSKYGMRPHLYLGRVLFNISGAKEGKERI